MVETNQTTILVVDDDQATLKIAAAFLQRAGYIVSTAGSGEEALELIRDSDGISLLLTDVIMPGLTGPELAAEAVRLHKTRRVLLMSAGTPDQLERYWAVGSGYPILPKPLSSPSLLAAVRHILA